MLEKWKRGKLVSHAVPQSDVFLQEARGDCGAESRSESAIPKCTKPLLTSSCRTLCVTGMLSTLIHIGNGGRILPALVASQHPQALAALGFSSSPVARVIAQLCLPGHSGAEHVSGAGSSALHRFRKAGNGEPAGHTGKLALVGSATQSHPRELGPAQWGPCANRSASVVVFAPPVSVCSRSECLQQAPAAQRQGKSRRAAQPDPCSPSPRLGASCAKNSIFFLDRLFPILIFFESIYALSHTCPARSCNGK